MPQVCLALDGFYKCRTSPKIRPQKVSSMRLGPGRDPPGGTPPISEGFLSHLH